MSQYLDQGETNIENILSDLIEATISTNNVHFHADDVQNCSKDKRYHHFVYAIFTPCLLNQNHVPSRGIRSVGRQRVSKNFCTITSVTAISKSKMFITFK